PIYTEEGTVQAETALEGVKLTVNVSLKLEILAKENGDWANNIWQGIGRGSKQYKKAIEYGGKVVEEKIMPGEDKRLELTDHSLGGRMASSVCAGLDRLYYDDDSHASVCNPSGVHPNTINPATGADGLSDGFAVTDDILTTLQ